MNDFDRTVELQSQNRKDTIESGNINHEQSLEKLREIAEVLNSSHFFSQKHLGGFSYKADIVDWTDIKGYHNKDSIGSFVRKVLSITRQFEMDGEILLQNICCKVGYWPDEGFFTIEVSGGGGDSMGTWVTRRTEDVFARISSSTQVDSDFLDSEKERAIEKYWASKTPKTAEGPKLTIADPENAVSIVLSLFLLAILIFLFVF